MGDNGIWQIKMIQLIDHFQPTIPIRWKAPHIFPHTFERFQKHSRMSRKIGNISTIFKKDLQNSPVELVD